MKLQFDPNDKKKPVAPMDWATYAPARSTAPEFKVHRNRGAALNAVHAALDMNTDIILYRWKEAAPIVEGDIKKMGEWVEHSRYEDFQMPDHCDNCGADLLQTLGGGRDGRGILYNRGNNVWINTNVDPKLITACNDCWRKLKR